jgi:hypothetical protein
MCHWRSRSAASRSDFQDVAEAVATVPHAVVEQAMGHQVGTQVERAYRRTDVLDKRRQLMEAWAAFCEPPAACRGPSDCDV